MNLFGFWHRRRYRDLVQRQLRLFAQENGALVKTARSKLSRYYETSDPKGAQEHYANYDDLSEDIEVFLFDMCERFSATMDPQHRRHYIDEFNRQARGTYKDIIALRRFDER